MNQHTYIDKFSHLGVENNENSNNNRNYVIDFGREVSLSRENKGSNRRNTISRSLGRNSEVLGLERNRDI